MKVEANLNKKWIKLTNEDFDVKIKFFSIKPLEEDDDEEEEEMSRLRLRFVKKRGDLAAWYEVFNQMKNTVLEDILLAPEAHHLESLATCDSDE
jgi:hypothetical protein